MKPHYQQHLKRKRAYVLCRKHAGTIECFSFNYQNYEHWFPTLANILTFENAQRFLKKAINDDKNKRYEYFIVRINSQKSPLVFHFEKASIKGTITVEQQGA